MSSIWFLSLCFFHEILYYLGSFPYGTWPPSGININNKMFMKNSISGTLFESSFAYREQLKRFWLCFWTEEGDRSCLQNIAFVNFLLCFRTRLWTNLGKWMILNWFLGFGSLGRMCLNHTEELNISLFSFLLFIVVNKFVIKNRVENYDCKSNRHGQAKEFFAFWNSLV